MTTQARLGVLTQEMEFVMKVRSSTGKIAGMTDAAVQAKTGKTWAEWLALLDKAGARKWTHREIIAYVHQKHGVGSWWQQMVTVGYEQARGLREKHQSASGYGAGVSRTIAAPVGTLYKAWTDAALRRRWLGSARFTITTATRNKSLRIKWPEGDTRVEVLFYPKAAWRCQMSVSHSRLAGQAQVTQKKSYWGKAIKRLVGLVTKS